MITTILFDLDGTLLPVDNDFFFRKYLSQIATVIPGCEPEAVGRAIGESLRAILSEREPADSVERRFAVQLEQRLGVPYAEQEPHYLRYYTEEFPKLAQHFSPMPQVRAALDIARAKGLLTVLATNPVFPGVATRERMRWAGVREEDFALTTFYEDCRYTKPNPGYYTHEVLARIGVPAEQCLMIGNDVGEDMMPAHALGMRTFLLTPHRVGAPDAPRCWDDEGDYDAMMRMIEGL